MQSLKEEIPPGLTKLQSSLYLLLKLTAFTELSPTFIQDSPETLRIA